MSLSTTTSSYSKTQHFYLHSLGHRLFSPWNGLKNLGFSIKPKKPFFHIIERVGVRVTWFMRLSLGLVPLKLL